jgi:hypothetical protein
MARNIAAAPCFRLGASRRTRLRVLWSFASRPSQACASTTDGGKSSARQCGFFGTPLGLGLAAATTSAPFLPHLEHRIRSASSLSVIDQPTRRAKASGSISRHAPQSQITRTKN